MRNIAAFGENAYVGGGREQQKTINPVFGKDAVTVMLATNNTYAPYCGVVLQSIIENADPVKNYDIVILNNDLEERYKILLESMTRVNLSVRVVIVRDYVSENFVESFVINQHFSIETYFRFFIPRLFGKYDKVVYMDCDMVVLCDIADLYVVEIGENWWGVARDNNIPILYFDSSTWDSKERVPYVKDILKMDSPLNYFQAGVMIWNVQQCIRDNVFDKLMERLVEIGNPYYVDQDVMNSVANGEKIFWISNYWNVPWYYSFYWPHFKGRYAYDTVMHQLENPFIIHYAGGVKPWYEPNRPNAHYFWRYARNTPFYEMLLQSLIMQSIPAIPVQPVSANIENHIQEASMEEIKNSKPVKIKITPRKIIKYLLPYGFVRLYQLWMKE